MYIDHHTHSTFSPDADNTIEEMCQKAIEAGLPGICFTEHIDVISEEKHPPFVVKDFLETVEKARQKFKDKLMVLGGVEFSEPHVYPDRFEEIREKDFDCILGSAHWIDELYMGLEEWADKYSVEETNERYYQMLLEIVKYGGFDVLAHFDFTRRYLGVKYENEELIAGILSLVIEKDIALEINTSTLRRGFEEVMPADDILRLYADLGGRKVTVGSDAHRVEEVGSGFERARKLVQEYGFTVGYYKKREWQN